MVLDVSLCKVLTKVEVAKLKNKYGVTDLVYPEKDNCEELNKIYFIETEDLINCDTNFKTLNNVKHSLVEREFLYYNVPAMILKSGVKTKYSDLSYYYMSEFSSSKKGYEYKQYEISNFKDYSDVIKVDFTCDEIKNLCFKEKKLGIYIKEVRFIQSKDVYTTNNLTGRCYNDVYSLFISTESQLKRLNENGVYEYCDFKRGFKIPKNHLLWINW